jgi:hypothetical protein
MASAPSIRAETVHVDELVTRAMLGRIRVPRFQRGFKWRDHDVQMLFDSIHRGFPIGTLLMWKRPASPELLSFGPVEVRGEETDDAWWVVDGQQRLTSLVAALRHPDVFDPDDPFVVYYDLRAEGEQAPFFRPHRLRRATPYCIPLARCFDAADFQQWLFEFVQATGQRSLIEPASGVATRLRNYRVPVYVVETDDVGVAKEIFLRTNRAGRRMDAHEVFAALAPEAAVDRSPSAVAERLASILGAVEPNVVTKAAKALVSNDITKSDSHPKVADHVQWMTQTEEALGAALQFLRECRVPHTRLLPAVPTPLITLARFFHRHPAPSARNRRLLRRWLWRGFFADVLGSDAKTLRRSVVAVTTDEDASVQGLLGQVPARAQYRLPADFDARHGPARLAALVMALEGPAPPRRQQQLSFLDPDASGGPFDWLEEHGSDAFTSLSGVKNSPAARFLTPGLTSARLRAQLEEWATLPHPAALESHLVTLEAASALRDGNLERFIDLRKAALQAAADSLYQALAEPEHQDRPALALRDFSS